MVAAICCLTTSSETGDLLFCHHGNTAKDGLQLSAIFVYPKKTELCKVTPLFKGSLQSVTDQDEGKDQLPVKFWLILKTHLSCRDPHVVNLDLC